MIASSSVIKTLFFKILPKTPQRKSQGCRFIYLRILMIILKSNHISFKVNRSEITSELKYLYDLNGNLYRFVDV